MTAVNGINVEQLNGMIEAVKKDPSLAKCTFTASTVWESGFRNRGQIQGYRQNGQTVGRPQPFVVKGDHPEGLLGTNAGPAAVEALLAAAGACIAGGWATFGAAMGVPIERLEVELEGNIDLRGFMGLDEHVRPGFQYIKGKTRVKSPATTEQLAQLKYVAETHSPVLDSLGVRAVTELVRL